MNSILILANNDMGLYKFRKELIQELLNLGHKVIISLPYGEFVEPLKEMGCEFINTPIDRRGMNPVKDIILLLSYIKIIKKLNPDFVLTYTIKPNIYGGLACRLTKNKYLTNITGLGTSILEGSVFNKILVLLYRISLKNAHCIFFQNEQNELYFKERKIFGLKSILLPGSGVNLDEFKYEDYPNDDSAIRFLYIGRIMNSKGINELIDAAQLIKHYHNEVYFDIVGFCDDFDESKLIKLNEEGIICYHGKKDDIHPFLKTSHAIVLPSYHEGTSNVLLESASTGRPILASDVPGCRETLDNNVTGLTFEPRNTESLFSALIKFIELPYKEKKEMGLEGRKKMEREYSRSFVVKAYINLIKEDGGK